MKLYLTALLSSALLTSACSGQGGTSVNDGSATPSGFKFSEAKLSKSLDAKVSDFLEICGPIIDAKQSLVPSEVGMGWEPTTLTVPDAGISQAFGKSFDGLDYILGVSNRPISDDQTIVMCYLKAKIFDEVQTKDLVDIKIFKKLGMDKGKIRKIEGGVMGEWESGEFPNVVTVGAESRATEYKGGHLASLSFYVTKIQSISEEEK